MAVNDWYKLEIVFTDLAGINTAMNTLAFQQGTSLILDEAGEDLIEAYRDQIEAQYIALVSAQYYLRAYTVRGITDPLYLYEVTGLGVQGTAGGDGLPPQNSCVVSLRTGVAGRRNRGRSYLVPTGEGAQANGGLIAGYTDAVSAMFADMMPLGGGVEFAQWHLGVWSEANNAGRRVTNVIPRPNIGTQRRRRLGVGS